MDLDFGARKCDGDKLEKQSAGWRKKRKLFVPSQSRRFQMGRLDVQPIPVFHLRMVEPRRRIGSLNLPSVTAAVILRILLRVCVTVEVAKFAQTTIC